MGWITRPIAMVGMQNIYCNKPGKAHLLARINGAVLEIYCVACKRWEPVSVVDIVRVVDMQNGHRRKDKETAAR